jgi:hypothetical protein
MVYLYHNEVLPKVEDRFSTAVHYDRLFCDIHLGRETFHPTAKALDTKQRS